MFGILPIQQDMLLTIVVWAVLVTVSMTAALWCGTATPAEARLTRAGQARPHATAELQVRLHSHLRPGELRTIRGTLQRVDYAHHELRVVADGNLWLFMLDRDSQLWFDERQAILRSFQPLDPVKIIFAEGTRMHVVKAMYAWQTL